MRILVTGATGKVGNGPVRTLSSSEHEVVALVRDPERARHLVPRSVQLVRGDVTDPSTLVAAMRSVELVYNAMGIPEQWVADEALLERVNVQGAGSVVRAARAAGARRVVHTSTG